MKSTWYCEAPSNIALIKYMGKQKGGEKNLPTNASFSYTLKDLITGVEVEKSNGEDKWQALTGEGWKSLKLSESAQTRYLAHWKFLKEYFEISGNFLIKSANNFASDCGLASSASSFAALTKVAQQVALDCGSKEKADMSLNQLAMLSRKGSGSSCRSFFEPWAYWKDDEVKDLDLPYKDLLHHVVIVEDEKKQVSSSEAHQRVTSSLLFQGRTERAELRSQQLMQALNQSQWQRAFEITWQEFWDMHALFETSDPAFGYMTEKSINVLHKLRTFWENNNDGPLVTMDAGANVHLLFRAEQKDMMKGLVNEF